MYNFPLPYPDELIYSTIARAGVHMGIISPKQLLDEVFADRHVIATTDLPGHLSQIATQYPKGTFSVDDLIYKHTLFPLYAPFIPEKRRQKCLQLLAGHSGGIPHLSLGVTASKVKQRLHLRACPKCMKAQGRRYGEHYWMRRWQVRGAECCPLHGSLYRTKVRRSNERRHNFEALTPSLVLPSPKATCSPEDKRALSAALALLALPPIPSPTLEQWSQFYFLLAQKNDCTRGKHMDFTKIKDRLHGSWQSDWLTKTGLPISDDETCWLKAMFRKHRKSMSYLQHIVVLEAFMGKEWDFQSVLQDVSGIVIPGRIEPEKSTPKQPGRKIMARRRQWKACLTKFGVKKGRQQGGGGAYAELYRNDRDWLLRINHQHRAPNTRRSDRVDWAKRDIALTAQLMEVLWTNPLAEGSPRRSKRWYLAQAGSMTSIVNHLDRLPRTSLFLEQYGESVESYQVRRLRRAIRTLMESGLPLKRWRLLRASGLSEERLKLQAKQFLERII